MNRIARLCQQNARQGRRWLFASLFVMGCGSAWAEQAATTVHLVLKSDVTLVERQFVVADVATVSSTNVQLKQALENVRVATTPRVGSVDKITREELKQIIHARLKNFTANVEWDGAKAVLVRAANRLAETDELVSAAKAHLLKAFEGRYETLEVALASPVADVELPLGAVSFVPRAIDAKHVVARVPVWVDIHVDGTMVRSVIVPFLLKATQLVYVAKRDIPAGEIASATEFDVKTEDVSAISDALVVQPFVNGAVRMKRPIMSGKILTQNYVSQDGAVFRGDAVKLILAQGGVLLETSGIAQQDARIGQSVKVKPEKSTEAVAGRVVSPGVVQANGV